MKVEKLDVQLRNCNRLYRKLKRIHRDAFWFARVSRAFDYVLQCGRGASSAFVDNSRSL